MKNETKYILGIALIFAGLVFWRLQERAPKSQIEDSPTKVESTTAEANHGGHSHDHDGDKSPLATGPKRTALSPQQIKSLDNSMSFKISNTLPIEEQERQSMQIYARAFNVFTHNDQKPETLVKKLAEAGLKPIVVQDFNEDTGKMITIKTDETLPGTRYFLAQYFEDENKRPFLQSMSIEFKPEEKTFDDAVAFINAANPGVLERCNPKMVAWECREGYTCWCQQMKDKEDFIDDPFRAYDYENDINTTHCAVQLNPHPQEGVCGD